MTELIKYHIDLKPLGGETEFHLYHSKEFSGVALQVMMLETINKMKWNSNISVFENEMGYMIDTFGFQKEVQPLKASDFYGFDNLDEQTKEEIDEYLNIRAARLAVQARNKPSMDNFLLGIENLDKLKKKHEEIIRFQKTPVFVNENTYEMVVKELGYEPDNFFIDSYIPDGKAIEVPGMEIRNGAPVLNQEYMINPIVDLHKEISTIGMIPGDVLGKTDKDSTHRQSAIENAKIAQKTADAWLGKWGNEK